MKTRSVFFVATFAFTLVFVSFRTHAQPVIHSVSTANGQATFSISNGVGPFIIQRANNVNDPWCSIATVNARTAVVGVDGPSVFLRVRDVSNAPPTRLTVSLSGAASQPPNSSTADGFGTLEIKGDTLTFDIAYRNLSSAESTAHIHLPSDTSGTANPSIFFDPFFIGVAGATNGRFAGSVTISAAQKAALLSGLAYVNVHSANFGGGEIRGQVTPTTFRVVLSATGERPNVNTSRAYGIGALTLIGNQLSYDIAYQGLTGPAILAHIHGPATMAGFTNVMYDLLPVGGFGASGTLSGRTNLTPAQIAALVDGKAYANIHTVANGAGEIRGQVLPFVGEAPFAADLTSFAERPAPLTNSATAFAFCALQSNILSFAMMYRNLSGPATLAHIHGAAPASGFAPPLFDLVPFHRGPLSTQGVFSGSVTLSTDQVSNLLNGDLYMNIHTALNGGGEVRGQLCPTIIPIALNSTNEPGGTLTSATGFGYLGLVGKQVSIGLHYRDLSSLANNAHLHGPGTASQNVGVLIPFNTASYTAGGFGTNGFLLGSQTIPNISSTISADDVVSYIVDGLTYVNIHSVLHGGGEIRSQVIP